MSTLREVDLSGDGFVRVLDETIRQTLLERYTTRIHEAIDTAVTQVKSELATELRATLSTICVETVLSYAEEAMMADHIIVTARILPEEEL